MAALKMEKLEELEAQYGLEPGELTYQQRCSRIASVLNGEEWQPPEPEKRQIDQDKPTISRINTHPLMGKTILITPLMYPDAKRFVTYDEVLGPEMTVREFHAGEAINGLGEDHDRMFGEYEILSRSKTKNVVAQTGIPKIGTELTYTIGRDLVPVVRGNSGERGYIWSLPSQTIQVQDTLIQLYGLKTLIQQVYPELLTEFKNKPMMSYIDGVTLAASIPLTTALLKKQQRKEIIDAKAGVIY